MKWLWMQNFWMFTRTATVWSWCLTSPNNGNNTCLHEHAQSLSVIHVVIRITPQVCLLCLQDVQLYSTRAAKGAPPCAGVRPRQPPGHGRPPHHSAGWHPRFHSGPQQVRRWIFQWQSYKPTPAWSESASLACALVFLQAARLVLHPLRRVLHEERIWPQILTQIFQHSFPTTTGMPS